MGLSQILEKIVGEKQREVAAAKKKSPRVALEDKIAGMEPPRSFLEAVSRPGRLNLIAEIKKASPSRGIIREDFHPGELARIYEAGGVAAISILTEEKYFLGSLEHLSLVRQEVKVPVLRKDFIFDEYQIYESRAAGADAILLITALLDREQIERYLALSRELGMDCLVEVHTEEELSRVLTTSAGIIGINNRDLKTFTVDFSTTLHLKRLIPPGKVIVSESGIRGSKEVKLLREIGINAILVGEAFLRAADIGEKIKEFMKGS